MIWNLKKGIHYRYPSGMYFYGAAASAYDRVGLNENVEVYNKIAEGVCAEMAAARRAVSIGKSRIRRKLMGHCRGGVMMWKCPKCEREFKNAEQSHFCGKINTIDDYIADQPADVQPLLQAIRETIRAAAPEAIEKIAWQMPTFWQGENLVHFAAFKKHIGFYPGGEAVGVFTQRLAGYKTSKGAIQFPLDKPVDHKLIADIVSWRVEQAKRSVST